jgi:hypothetical protein
MAHSHFSFGSESFNKLEKHNIAIHLSRRHMLSLPVKPHCGQVMASVGPTERSMFEQGILYVLAGGEAVVVGLLRGRMNKQYGIIPNGHLEKYAFAED